MKRSFYVLPLLFLLPIPFSRAQDPPPKTVAKIASQAKVRKLERSLRILEKRIEAGVHRKLLSDDTARDLASQVQAIRDREEGMMGPNGAQVLTQGQVKELQEQVLELGERIHRAKHPGAPAPRP